MTREWEPFLTEGVRERLERMCSVPLPVDMGMVLDSISENGEVRVSMDVSDKLNAVGGGHGGAVFALADQAFAIASNLGEHPQVALSANISYVKAARGRLTALARMVYETRRTSVYEVKVLEGEELVAIFQGTGYKLNGKVDGK